MKAFLVILIRVYQAAVSPFIGNHCRFHPSCSAYGIEAIEMHGCIRGLALTAWRLVRCHPFNSGGFDPVPGRCAFERVGAQDD